jgi:ribonuclease BN (tRNA processing enzyme)
VKIMLLPSASEGTVQYLTSFLVNDRVAIDAGSLGFYRRPEEQAQVRHVFLSHAHIDHIASLPIFVENAYEGKADCVTVHGSEPVLHCLRQDVFNNRVWPDFLRLSSPATPFLKLLPLTPGVPVDVEGLRITPIPVNHAVPTFGFLVEGPDAAVLIPGDTGPTEEIWQRANAVEKLKAVFLETTFPDEMAALADVSGHLTPATFRQELNKLNRPVPVIVIHIKPRYRAAVMRELAALNLPNLAIGESGRAYAFG